MTDDQIKQAIAYDATSILGKFEGIATALNGTPQHHYEYGFISHKVARLGSIYARPYDQVKFDRHPDPDINGRCINLS